MYAIIQHSLSTEVLKMDFPIHKCNYPGRKGMDSGPGKPGDRSFFQY